MSDLQWTPEGEKLFGQLIEALPEAMRNLAKPQIIDFLKAKSGGKDPVTPDMIHGMVDELPEPQKGMMAQALGSINDDDDGIDEAAVEKILAGFSATQDQAIAILHEIQTRFGYVPEGALKIMSARNGIAMSTLYRLAKNYTAFRLEPPKKNVVTLCNGTGCHLHGASDLLAKLRAKAALEDSGITIETVRCLGMCDMSPALILNGIPYGGAAAEAQIEKLLG